MDAFFWQQKYGQSSTRDAGTVSQVTSPVNTNARIDYETLRMRLAPETAQVTLEVRRLAHFGISYQSTNPNFIYFFPSLPVVLKVPKFLTVVAGALL